MVEIVEKKVVDTTYYGYYNSNNNFNYHREDGPAIIYPDGTQIWCFNGEIHREDGPAFIDSYGRQEWWFESKNITGEIEKWLTDHEISDYYTCMTEEDKFALTFFMRSLV